MSVTLNLVEQTTTTTGTGTLTLGAATQGMLTLASYQATVPDGTLISYGIRTGAVGSEQFEVGIGTVGGSGTTLARTTLVASSTGARLNLAGTSVFYSPDLSGDHENGNIPTAAISDGATSPDPGSASLRYSSTTFRLMAWFAGAWRSIASIMQNNTWTAAQRGTITTVTDASTITLDLNNQFFVLTMTSAGGTGRTMANPTNIVAGQSGAMRLIQGDATQRGFTSWGSAWKRAGGLPAFSSFSTGSGKYDVLYYMVWATGEIQFDINNDIRNT